LPSKKKPFIPLVITESTNSSVQMQMNDHTLSIKNIHGRKVSLVIFSLQGAAVVKKQLTCEFEQIFLGHLSGGMYIISLHDGEKIEYTKMVMN